MECLVNTLQRRHACHVALHEYPARYLSIVRDVGAGQPDSSLAEGGSPYFTATAQAPPRDVWIIVRAGPFREAAVTATPNAVCASPGVMTMIGKTLIAFTAALAVVTSLVSVADAQRAPRPNAGQPFTEMERNWFEIPEQPERLPR